MAAARTSADEEARQEQHENKPRQATAASAISTTVTGVINYVVRTEHSAEYEVWVKELVGELRNFPGFIRRDVVQSSEQDGLLPVSLLLVFDTEANLKRWQTSRERWMLLDRARDLELFDTTHYELGKIRIDTTGKAISWNLRSAQAGSTPAKARPPPKWKLVLLITCLVWTAMQPWAGAELLLAMVDTGWFGFGSALLVTLAVLVALIIYAYAEFVTKLPLGPLSIERWLKRQPFSKPAENSRCPVVFAWMLCNCLQDGCGCFEPPPQPQPPPAITERLERTERRLESLRQLQHGVNKAQYGAEELLDVVSETTRLMSSTEPNVTAQAQIREQTAVALDGLEQEADPPSPHDGHAEPLTVIVHHYIRWECIDAYKDWVGLMHAQMKLFDGFVSLRIIYPDGAEDAAHSAIFRFESPQTLHKWMYSTEREEMLLKLEPLLHSPDLVAATRNRDLPDAFTDTFASRDGVPLRPPPKWKIVVLTTAGLWLAAFPVNSKMPGVLTRMGITTPEIQSFVLIYLNTFFNTYCCVPILKHLCGAWLEEPREPWWSKQPWRAIDEGPKTQMGRLCLLCCYFVPTIIALIIHKQDDGGSM